MGRDLEADSGTVAITVQWQGKHVSTTVELLLGKHVPTAVVMPAMGETVCCLCGPCQRVIKRREFGATRQLSSTRVAEKRWCNSSVDGWQEFYIGGCECRT